MIVLERLLIAPTCLFALFNNSIVYREVYRFGWIGLSSPFNLNSTNNTSTINFKT